MPWTGYADLGRQVDSLPNQSRAAALSALGARLEQEQAGETVSWRNWRASIWTS